MKYLKIYETDNGDLSQKWRALFRLKNDETLENKIVVSEKKFTKAFLKYLMYIGEEIFAYPDVYNGWCKLALTQGNKLLSTNKYDLILGSYPPASAFIVASKLSKKFKIPWIADYRDSWTQYRMMPSHKYSLIREYFEKGLEKKDIDDSSRDSYCI